MDTSSKGDKAKIVTTIKVSQKAWLEESVDDHLQCVLCGTHLTFKHKTDFITGHVHEDAHCSGCGVRNRQTVYNLQ